MVLAPITKNGNESINADITGWSGASTVGTKLNNMIRSILLVMILSSCTAYHHGTLTESEQGNETTSITDLAHGYARVSRFWIFGGNGTDALIADAKRNMILNHPLKSGEHFANFILDFKEAYYFPGFHTTTVIITAEVITQGNSDYLSQIREQSQTEYQGYHLGQSVLLKVAAYGEVYIEAEILAFRKNKIVIGFIDHQGRYKTKSVTVNELKNPN